MNKKNLISIAIVDDHTMMREGLAKLISGFGEFSVILQACNGLDLINQLNTCSNLPEICIIDVKMPELNGYDTVKRLKMEFPKIKTLGLSMYDAAYSAIEMIRNGASAFLNKTGPPEKLYEQLIKMTKNEDEENKQLESILFSDRELEFLKLCTQNLIYKEIATEMNICVNTVHRYRENLFEKLGLNSRIALAIFAYQNGIISN